MDEDQFYFVTSIFSHEPVGRLSLSEVGNVVDALTSPPNKFNQSPIIPLSPSNLRKHASSYLVPEPTTPNIPSLIDPASSNTTTSFNIDQAKSKRKQSEWESFEIQHAGRTVSMAQLSHLRVAETSPKENTPSTGNAILSVPKNGHERHLSMGVDPDDDLSPDALGDELDSGVRVSELELPLFSSSVIIHDYSGHRPAVDNAGQDDVDYEPFYEERSDSQASSNESWLDFKSSMRLRIHDRLQLILKDLDDRIESCQDRFPGAN